MEQQAIITVKDLRTYFYSDKRCNKVLNGISFELYKGRTLCVVGESGCGKSVTALSVLGLVRPPGQVTQGEILFGGRDLRKLPEKELRNLRGNRIAMIFQDPMTSLNPVYTVGAQVCDYVYVMYAGQIVEQAETFELFRNPRHPYTLGLLKAIPSLEGEEKRLYNIRGSVPDLSSLPPGCRFCQRCDCVLPVCARQAPRLVEVGEHHQVRCVHPTV